MSLIFISICTFPKTTDLEHLFKLLLLFHLIVVIADLHTSVNFPCKVFIFPLIFFPIDLLDYYILNNNPLV